MAIDITKANAAQQSAINAIIAAGRKAGEPDAVIQAAILIANAESSFDSVATAKPTPGNPNPTAFGLFQCTNQTWGERWAQFVKANPNDLLAKNSASDVRTNNDAQIAIKYQDLNKALNTQNIK
jgi:hypothetical protein